MRRPISDNGLAYDVVTELLHTFTHQGYLASSSYTKSRNIMIFIFIFYIIIFIFYIMLIYASILECFHSVSIVCPLDLCVQCV